MIKKVIATAAIAASVMGASAAVAPQAMAADNDFGPASWNGNGAMESFGNSTTYGSMSPQMALIQGSFNRPCIALSEIPVGVLQIVNIQDLQLLADRQNQQCADNSTVNQRDGALAHLLENVSLLSTSTDDGGDGGGKRP